MSEITTGILIGGLIVFLVQWAGKHFLDRLVLPRILDWWARQSKKMALNRAQSLLKQFELDFQLYSNVHLLLLRVEERQIRTFSYPFIIILLLVYAIFANQFLPSEKSTFQELAFLLFAILAMCAQWFFGIIYMNRRDYRTFADFNLYRQGTISRLEKLFQAADLSKEEIRDRIEHILTLSTPEP